jgi:hypothetical protein
MTEASSASVELALVLPLGVVVNQLLRTEAHLRLLNMKTLDFASERSTEGFAGPIALRLEQIHETLDSIRGLVANIEADLRPGRPNAARASIEEDTSRIAAEQASDDERSSLDVVYARRRDRKSPADWDD